MGTIGGDLSQCPEKEMNKNFENQQRDLCREVQYASEVPKNYLRTLCVIGSPMQIFKKTNFYHCVKILSGNLTKTDYYGNFSKETSILYCFNHRKNYLEFLSNFKIDNCYKKRKYFSNIRII